MSSTSGAREDEDAVCVRLQERLLTEDADVLAIPEHLERRLRLRTTLGRYLVDEGVASDRLAGLLQMVSDRVSGLGPLEPLLRDPTITEIMVNGSHAVFVERRGQVRRVDATLGSDAFVHHLIDRIVAPLGVRIDASQPWVDARLPDGSRVHAIVPPLATTGPTITIRRTAETHPSLDDLVSTDSLDIGAACALADAVRDRRSIVVCGGAGAGKTTLLRALCGEIPPEERVITIEDAAELALRRDHVVALEARPANCEGHGQVTIRDLVRQSLRMRPDRIIVGEVRGGEVMDMLQAMNTGHAGSMSTVHANSPDDLMTRIEAMAMMTEHPMSADAIQRQIRSAIDLVVHVSRDASGKRGVRSIARLDGLAGLAVSADTQ